MRLMMTTDAIGGVCTYTIDVAASLRDRGHDVTIAIIGPQAERALHAARNAGLSALHLPGPLDWLAQDESELAITRESIAAAAAGQDAVIVHAPALVPEQCDCAVLAVIHSCIASWWEAVRGTQLPPEFRWQAEATAQGLRRAMQVIAPSAAYAAAVERIYGLRQKVTVVHNGRIHSGACPAPDANQSSFILASGRVWDDAKNMALLDRIAPDLPWPVRIAGDTRGPQGQTLVLSQAESLGQIASTVLQGQLAQRPIFVSPARYEPFGLGVLEAAQNGCALVLSDIPTFRELWDGAACFSDPADDASFVGAIRSLIERPERRQALGLAARQRAARYCIASCANRLAEVTRSLLQPLQVEFAP